MDTDRDVLQMIWESMQAGCAGASIGRNVFQAQNPTKMVRAMAKIIHEKYNVEDAIRELSS